MHLVGTGKTIVHRADKMNYDSSLFKNTFKKPRSYRNRFLYDTCFYRKIDQIIKHLNFLFTLSRYLTTASVSIELPLQTTRKFSSEFGGLVISTFVSPFSSWSCCSDSLNILSSSSADKGCLPLPTQVLHQQCKIVLSTLGGYCSQSTSYMPHIKKILIKGNRYQFLERRYE